MLIRGSYYRSGDSVLFQAEVMDVASGRVLKSFDPVGAPVERATVALEALRERIAGGLSPLVNALNRGNPVDPDLALPPESRRLPRVRGRSQGAKARRLGGRGRALPPCGETGLDLRGTADPARLSRDPERRMLDHRFGRRACSSLAGTRLSLWNRLTIDLLRARCRGDMAEAVRLLEQRHTRLSQVARRARAHYASALQHSNQPRAAREILRQMDPERDLGWWDSPERGLASVLVAHGRAPGTWWADIAPSSTSPIAGAIRQTRQWQIVRGRALAALGREREVMDLLRSTAGARSTRSPSPS